MSEEKPHNDNEPIEFSSCDEDEDRPHYDKMMLPPLIRYENNTPSATFHVLRSICTGRFSQIFVVRERDRSLSHDAVVLKLLRRRKVETLIAFENELSLYRFRDGRGNLLTHVLPLLDYYRGHDMSFIVTELAGPNLDILRSNLLKREFNLDSSMRLAFQSLEAVTALHRNNILHNNICPQNFVVGVGVHACVLYMIGFTALRKMEPKKKRSRIHFPHPVYAPMRMLPPLRNTRDVSMLDDLQSWLFTVADLVARRQLDWVLNKKKYTWKSNIKDLEMLAQLKMLTFTSKEKFQSLANVPKILQDIGKIILQAETADYDTHHDAIQELLRGWLHTNEIYLASAYEWESTTFNKEVLKLMLGKHASQYNGVYLTKPVSLESKDAKIKKLLAENMKFENSDDEAENDEKVEKEKVRKMHKNMTKLVSETINGQPFMASDEEPSDDE